MTDAREPARSIRSMAGPAGRLEVLLEEPDGPPRAAAVVGHPHPLHGGTMHTKAVFQTAKGLIRAGCAVLRLNFRGVGASEGTFGGGEGEQDDFRAALDFMTARYPGRDLWAAGFSFGAWVAWSVGAADERVTTLIAVGLPVTSHDLEAAVTSPKPKFLVHGEEDELIPIREIRRFYARLEEPKELVVVDAADHLFDGKTTEVGEAVEELLT